MHGEGGVQWSSTDRYQALVGTSESFRGRERHELRAAGAGAVYDEQQRWALLLLPLVQDGVRRRMLTNSWPLRSIAWTSKGRPSSPRQYESNSMNESVVKTWKWME